jgi:hypothetical protein
VIVAWKSENGSARDDSDYTAGIGTLTCAPGETVHPVTVKISGDTTAEPNETSASSSALRTPPRAAARRARS